MYVFYCKPERLGQNIDAFTYCIKWPSDPCDIFTINVLQHIAYGHYLF